MTSLTASSRHRSQASLGLSSIPEVVSETSVYSCHPTVSRQKTVPPCSPLMPCQVRKTANPSMPVARRGLPSSGRSRCAQLRITGPGPNGHLLCLVADILKSGIPQDAFEPRRNGKVQTKLGECFHGVGAESTPAELVTSLPSTLAFGYCSATSEASILD